MAKPASEWAAKVASRARGFNLQAKRLEKLYAHGSITRVDIERVYAGCFVLFGAYLEQAIEQYFVGLLMGGYVPSDPQFRPLVTMDSYAVAYSVVRGERKYLDWLPYRRYTWGRAKAFFSRGEPFTKLSAGEIRRLDDIGTMRNALAHESTAAKRKFISTFINGRLLPPSQRRPAAYLRANHAAGQTKFDLLLSAAVSSAKMLTR